MLNFTGTGRFRIFAGGAVVAILLALASALRLLPDDVAAMLPLQVATPRQLELYDGASRSGARLLITQDVPDLAALGWDNRAVSAYSNVTGNQRITMWSEPNYKGRCADHWILKSTDNLNDFDIGAMQVSSVKLFSDPMSTTDREQRPACPFKMTFRGEAWWMQMQARNDTPDLAALGWSGKVHEVDGPAMTLSFYTGPNYTGTCHQMGSPTQGISWVNFADTPIGVGKLASYRVGPCPVAPSAPPAPNVPKSIASRPAIVHTPWSGQVRVFAEGTGSDGQFNLWHGRSDVAYVDWQGPVGLPVAGWVVPTRGVAIAATPGNNDIHELARSPGDALWHRRSFDGGQTWNNWTRRTPDGTITSAPAVAVWSADRFDVFARSATGKLYHGYMNNTQWTDDPDVSSWGQNRLDVFYRTTGNDLHVKTYDGAWRAPQLVSSSKKIDSDPAAISWGPNRIDVFAKGTNGQLYHVWTAGSGWVEDPADYLGGNLTGAPSVASRGANQLQVYVQTSDWRLGLKTFDGQWRPWEGVA
jgi:hypothetical protein